MKHTFYNIACMMLVALGCLCACQEDLDNASWTGDENTLLLNLETTAVQQSRSAGEDDYNENTVTSADVFFFASDGSGTCIYAQTGLVPTDTQLRVKLDNDKVSFDNTYYIYVIANGRSYYTDVTDDTALGMTLDQLKAVKVTTEWENNSKEESLLMDGEASVTLSKTTPGTVQLTRAMAKVALFPTVESSIESNGVTYKPILTDMNVAMVYGVKSTNLAGDYAVTSDDYVDRISRTYTETDGTYTHVPLYSYPNPEETTDRQDTYLMLCVPWAITLDDGSQQSANYYYRVPITGSSDVLATLERNHYYKVNVKVGVLGSLDPSNAVELTPDFAIYDWFDLELSADMQRYQYLVLDEYSSVMNNDSELRMPYISSSELTTKTLVTKVTYPDYNDSSAGDYSFTSTVTLDESQAATAGFSVDWDDDELIFTHPITSDDYVPFTITVEVWNDEGLQAVWEITQYPAIYIVGDYNSNGANNRFVYGVSTGNQSSMTVNDDQNQSLGNVYNPITYGASNTNLNQYNIYITSFDIEGSNYAIGDPRSSTVDNLQNLSRQTDSQRRTLTYYYPTREDDVENVIAPAFKIASSWGVTSTVLNYDRAQRRCASYQENGYPAGRWRIPTEAEIEYIVSLSDRGVMPALFNGQYFASSGRYYDNGYDSGRTAGFYTPSATTGNSSYSYAVRCVYDVWYWSDDQIANPNVFTWGDEQMQ